MLAIAIPAGLLIGLSLGALGGGGSILTVPALVYLLHQQPHAATTASLLIVGITAVAGMAAHWRAGRVRFTQGITFGLLGIAGSYAGTRLSASISPDLLLALFSGLMLAAAAAMVRRRRTGPAAAAASPPAPSPGRPPAPGHPAPGTGATRPAGQAMAAALHRPGTGVRTPARGIPWSRLQDGDVIRAGLKIVVAATVVGMLTGFFGVGGGFVIVPALVLALGFEMPAAVGTSLLVISANSAAALAAAYAVLLIAVAGYTLARSLPLLL